MKIGEKKCVYKYLFFNFVDVVMKGEIFWLYDMIYVWLFNKCIMFFCVVECKNFYLKLVFIKVEYKKEFDGENFKEMCLYDVVVIVMDKIWEIYKEYLEVDFFLVLFMDGVDNKSENVFFDGMMMRINFLMGRLYMFFIMVNMLMNLDLYK